MQGSPKLDFRDPTWTQRIRLLDVLVIGPLMVAGAAVPSRLPMPARIALGFFGVTTSVYNAVNYLAARQEASWQRSR